MADQNEIGDLIGFDDVRHVPDVGVHGDLPRQEVAALAEPGLGRRPHPVALPAQPFGHVAPDPAAAVSAVHEDVLLAPRLWPWLGLRRGTAGRERCRRRRRRQRAEQVSTVHSTILSVSSQGFACAVGRA